MKHLLISLTAFIMLSSCATIKVTSDLNADADFSKIKSYQVVQFLNEEDLNAKKFPTNELNKKRVESAITNEANARGLAQNEDPDIVILWSVNVDIQKSYSTHTDYAGGGYWGYRGRYGGYGMGNSYSTTTEYETVIGILSIAAVDRDREELLWIGTGQKEIQRDSDKAEENINKVVSSIFEEFPIAMMEE